jgi:hypothetical protein
MIHLGQDGLQDSPMSFTPAVLPMGFWWNDPEFDSMLLCKLMNSLITELSGGI